MSGSAEAVAYRAFDRAEAWLQVGRYGVATILSAVRNKPVVKKPLCRMRHRDCGEAPFDAAHHHVAGHLAADAHGAATDEVASGRRLEKGTRASQVKIQRSN
jgi:hypothetical protein